MGWRYSTCSAFYIHSSIICWIFVEYLLFIRTVTHSILPSLYLWLPYCTRYFQSSMFSLPSCGKFIRSHRNWVKNWTLRNKSYILTAHLRECALETEILVILLIFKAQMAYWKHLWIAHLKYSTFIHNWSTPGYNSQMKQMTFGRKKRAEVVINRRKILEDILCKNISQRADPKQPQNSSHVFR